MKRFRNSVDLDSSEDEEINKSVEKKSGNSSASINYPCESSSINANLSEKASTGCEMWKFFDKKNSNSAQCKLCLKILSTKDSNTSGLWKHMKAFHCKNLQPRSSAENITKKQCQLSDFFSSAQSVTNTGKLNSKLSKELDALACRSIVLDKRPLDDYEKPGLVAFLAIAVPGYLAPSRKRIKLMLANKVTEIEEQLKIQLNEADTVSITFDMWSNCKQKSFINVTCHFLDSLWKLHSFILCFKTFAGHHTASNIQTIVHSNLQKFNLLNKVFVAVTDNGANVLKSCKLLDVRHMSCFAHLLHLIVIKSIKLFEPANRSLSSQAETSSSRQFNCLNDLFDSEQDFDYGRDSESQGNESESDLETIVHDIDMDQSFCLDSTNDILNNMKVVVSKVRNVVKHFKHSCVASEHLLNHCFLLNVDQLTLISDCRTRWNSTYLMIERALFLRKPITAYFVEEISQRFSNKCQSLLITQNEWNSLEILLEVLKPYFMATKLLSASNYGTISMGYSIIKGLRQSCETQVQLDHQNLSQLLKASLLKHLDVYFSEVNENVDFKLLTCASYLDPRMLPKLSQQDLREAEKLMKNLMQEEMAGCKHNLSGEPLVSSDPMPPTNSSSSNISQRKSDSLFDIFCKTVGLNDERLSLKSKSKCPSFDIENEIKTYRNITLDPMISHNCDVAINDYNLFKFWKENSATLPLLAVIAKRILSVPITSVPSEVAFSVAGNIMRPKRSNLSPKVLDMLMFLSDKAEGVNFQ